MRAEKREMRWLVRVTVMMIAVMMTFTVLKTDASAARISKSSISIYEGQKYNLKVNGASEVKWKSGNRSVAVVSSKGRVTGRKTGTTMITAKTGGQTLLCSVRVKSRAKKVTLNTKNVTLSKGQRFKLRAKVFPASANQQLRWRSSNRNVAVVSSSGSVRAVNPGMTKITATTRDGSNKKISCKITVKKEVQATGVSLNKKSVSVQEGQMTTLVASVLPVSTTNKAIKWTSSNEKIATVSTTGVVKAVNKGKTTITVQTMDGSNKKAKCTVTVTAPPISNPPVQTGSSSARLLATLERYEKQLQADKAAGIRWHYYRGASKEGRQYAQTFSEALETNNRVSDCAILVRWAMKDIGAIDKKTSFWWTTKMVYGGSNKSKSKADLYDSCYIMENVNKTPVQLEAEGKLKPGDILCWTLNGGTGHMNVYAGNGRYFDSGKNAMFNTSSGGKIYFNSWKPAVNYNNEKVRMLIRVK
ncbi:MAG: Ig-like domain-containing protein [Marvinbryantia sp.]|jgi:uncharacterized protein YjdB